MATVTAPYVETQQVVTGYMYQLTLAEGSQGRGIVRMEIGPYFFEGFPPKVKYPESVTNEMALPGWSSVHWVTDAAGASWLRWDGGVIYPEDGAVTFQMTSNYPPANNGAALHVWRQGARSAERYEIAAPDYTQVPPKINPRHDVIGQGTVFARSGCATGFAIFALSAAALLHHLLS